MSEPVVCAILAAGRGTRMGGPKATLRFDDSTLVGRAVAAARGRRTIVVCSSGEAEAVRMLAGETTTIVRNDEPHRGMTHSLRLAVAAAGDPYAKLLVLLVDTPLVDAAVVARVIAKSGDADVTFPVSAWGLPGHPVLFGRRTRPLLDELGDGDTLRALRDDPRLTRCRVRFDDERPFFDVDYPRDLVRTRLADEFS